MRIWCWLIRGCPHDTRFEGVREITWGQSLRLLSECDYLEHIEWTLHLWLTMMAMATPGKCPVFFLICSVTSWRSKSVLPHDGHDTKSVFTDLILLPIGMVPCRYERDVMLAVFLINDPLLFLFCFHLFWSKHRMHVHTPCHQNIRLHHRHSSITLE